MRYLNIVMLVMMIIYESNYTNSNKREANRDEQSLFDESQGEVL